MPGFEPRISQPTAWSLQRLLYAGLHITKVGTKVIPLYFFLRNYCHNYNEIDTYRGYILYKVEINFPLNLLHCQHNFLKTLCAGRVKPFDEESELFTHAVLQLDVVRTAASS